MSLMMNIGKTGVKAYQEQVNVGAHNIANVNTVGFKQNFSEIKDLIYFENDKLIRPGNPGYDQGTGVKSSEAYEQFNQGVLMQTNTTTNYAIDGEGFFAVRDQVTNELMLTRSGEFSFNEAGDLVDYRGNKVEMHQITDAQNNQVLVPTLFQPTQLSQLEKANNGYYRVDENNMISNENNPDALGSVKQGFLEGSNVDLAEQMTNLMIAQRAYSMNMKTVQTADETLQLINQLR